jgi:hypothetical protein
MKQTPYRFAALPADAGDHGVNVHSLVATDWDLLTGRTVPTLRPGTPPPTKRELLVEYLYRRVVTRHAKGQ